MQTRWQGVLSVADLRSTPGAGHLHGLWQVQAGERPFPATNRCPDAMAAALDWPNLSHLAQTTPETVAPVDYMPPVQHNIQEPQANLSQAAISPCPASLCDVTPHAQP